MQKYLDLVKYILENGSIKKSRSGGRTLSIFNYNYEIDLNDGFPILTTKKIDFKNLVIELLWLWSGSKNIQFLHKHNVHFWDTWVVDEHGNTDTQYHYWTAWPELRQDLDGLYYDEEINQVKEVIRNIKQDPNSRRHVASLWDARVAWANWAKGGLPPCHFAYVFNVQNDKEGNKFLNLHTTARSNDIGLGTPFNWAGYALLLHLMSRFVNIPVGKLAGTIVDAHIYIGKEDGDSYDHRPALLKQLERDPKKLPQLFIDPSIQTYEDFIDLTREDVTTEEILNKIRLIDYNPDSFIKMKAAP